MSRVERFLRPIQRNWPASFWSKRMLMSCQSAQMVILGREHGHMSGFIAPHIFLATTRLGLHDTSRGRSASAHERGANRGAQIIRRGKKEAGRASSGPFGVEPYSRRSPDCASVDDGARCHIRLVLCSAIANSVSEANSTALVWTADSSSCLALPTGVVREEGLILLLSRNNAGPRRELRGYSLMIHAIRSPEPLGLDRTAASPFACESLTVNISIGL